MTVQNRRRILVAVIPVLLCSTAYSADKITFKFNPPNGINYVEKSRTVRVREGSGLKTVDVTNGQEKYTVTKTAKGFSIADELLSMDTTRDGQPMADSMNVLMNELMGSELIHIVDTNGRCSMVAMRGQSKLVKSLQRRMSGRMPEAMVKSIPGIINNITTTAKGRWNDRIGRFAGRTVRIGQVWYETRPISTPFGGKISASVKTKIVGRFKYKGRDCIKMSYTQTISPAVAKNYMLTFIKKSPQQTPTAPDPKVFYAHVSGSGERLIDPKTMLLLSETEHFSARMTTAVPNRGKVNTALRQTRELAYHYDSN